MASISPLIDTFSYRRSRSILFERTGRVEGSFLDGGVATCRPVGDANPDRLGTPRRPHTLRLWLDPRALSTAEYRCFPLARKSKALMLAYLDSSQALTLPASGGVAAALSASGHSSSLLATCWIGSECGYDRENCRFKDQSHEVEASSSARGRKLSTSSRFAAAPRRIVPTSETSTHDHREAKDRAALWNPHKEDAQ
jgi:hypothetical protein